MPPRSDSQNDTRQATFGVQGDVRIGELDGPRRAGEWALWRGGVQGALAQGSPLVTRRVALSHPGLPLGSRVSRATQSVRSGQGFLAGTFSGPSQSGRAHTRFRPAGRSTPALGALGVTGHRDNRLPWIHGQEPKVAAPVAPPKPTGPCFPASPRWCVTPPTP